VLNQMVTFLFLVVSMEIYFLSSILKKNLYLTSLIR
jgi:hypothetical protein